MARVELPKSNLRQRRRKRRIIFSCIVGMLCVLALMLVVGVTWLPFMRVQYIHIEGERTVKEGDIQATVEGELRGGYANLFAKSNIFLYPRGGIESKLTETFPTIRQVRVRAKGFQTINVQVTEREPTALWCGVEFATSSGCFLMDKDGVVFATALVYSGDAYQKFYGPVEGSTLPQGYLSQVQFRSLMAFADAMQKGHNGRIATIAVTSSGDVRCVFDSGFVMLFDLSASASDVLERFNLALRAKPFASHSLEEFEYLDLRFGDRLYYKLKAQYAPVPTAASTSATLMVR